ncbi:P-loop containing nucleoside triphosphate hydrolase protein [Lipomyces japonicus]|uniref:P-loop containing nucleoside triphosphate hydrolase protein n=1 Tax=Lipomyces japonicus TaxID=56871 RepID=UPI0034CD7D11
MSDIDVAVEHRRKRKSVYLNDEGIKLSWSSSDEAENGVKHQPHGQKERRTLRKRSAVPTAVSSADDSVPSYFISRRREFDNKVKQDGRNLMLPPNYDGLEDELKGYNDLEELQTRPQFENVEPRNKKEDVVLRKSLGVIPKELAMWLRSYQIEGVSIMHNKFVYQQGMILGDDMGLGKTVQVVSFLTVAFGKTGDSRDRFRMRVMRRHDRWYPRILIVCPGSILKNWQRELDTWGWWVCDTFHGPNKDEVLKAMSSGMIEIMLTTYQTYRLYQSEINLIEWDCCVADECHVIKESTSEITRAMNQLNCLCRIGLTGTAIQNAYEDMWSLLDWANPGALGDKKTWIMKISKPLKAGQSHDASLQELSIGRTIAKNLVNNLLPRFFLRRTKELIADQLPKKRDMAVFCPLSKLQEIAYENYIAPEERSRMEVLIQPCTCNNAGTCESCVEMAKADGEHFFVKCINSLKFANHLAYIIPRNEDAPEIRNKDMTVFKKCLPDQWERLFKREPILNYSDPQLCGKWIVLNNFLKVWKQEGDKVLIFSYSTRLLRMLDSLLTNHGYSFCYLDGSMSYRLRQEEVDKFNNDPNQFIFLLSTRAGGLGLNIVSANRVVIWDPNWNPTHDLQAQDRAFRLGQQRDVNVYRLISAGTIEEIVYARQIYKQQQANIGYNASTERRYFNGVMGMSDKPGELFGIKNLFKFAKNEVMLKHIVNKTNVAEAVSADGAQIMELPDQVGNNDDEDAEDENSLDDDDHAEQKVRNLLKGPRSKMGLIQKKNEKRPPDVISAILNQAGVKYVHENSEVIGSSEVEQRISREAMRQGNTQAANYRPFTNPEIEAQTKLRPPKYVCERQFNTMAREFGYESPVQFALYIENVTQKKRREILNKFYNEKLPMLRF